MRSTFIHAFVLGIATIVVAPALRAGEAMPELKVLVVSGTEAQKKLATRIEGLIAQLGHEDHRLRDRAVEGLHRIGRGALPSVERAMLHDDPEVAARAEHLAMRLRKAPDGSAVRYVRERLGQNRVVSAQNVASVRQISSLAPDNKVLILRDGDWLTLIFTSVTKERGPLREQYHARNEAELRENHPAVYELYEMTLRQLPSDSDRQWWRTGSSQ